MSLPRILAERWAEILKGVLAEIVLDGPALGIRVTTTGEGTTAFTVHAAACDYSRIIGAHGQMLHALIVLTRAYGGRHGTSATVQMARGAGDPAVLARRARKIAAR